MIFVVSDDIALGENLNEILSLDGIQQVKIKNNHFLHEYELRNGVEMIIYCHSQDPDGSRFNWYLLANNLLHIPIVFLTTSAQQSDNSLHKYIEIPFELTELSSVISYFFALR